MKLWYENREDQLEKYITHNFTLDELKCKCGQCNLTALDSILLEKLNLSRIEYGKAIHANSCYRCQGHNRDIGGSLYSYHPRGMAIDIELPENEEDRNRLIEILQKHFPVTRIYPNKGFIHCDVGMKRTW